MSLVILFSLPASRSNPFIHLSDLSFPRSIRIRRAPSRDAPPTMAHSMRDDPDAGGFNFDNVRRNDMLRGTGLHFKNAMKTGTTISGIVFKGGVVLGADTRSTNGETVADKNCEKIHYIAPNIYCCGAGTAADTEAVTGKRRAA